MKADGDKVSIAVNAVVSMFLSTPPIAKMFVFAALSAVR